ncbi:helix-turn-helix domain-containing protein [Kocuria rhizophila]|nr:helix-turn-helix domain-containing protein [Kocuria rhizophila]
MTVVVGRAPSANGPAGVTDPPRRRAPRGGVPRGHPDRPLVLVLGGLKDGARSLSRLASVFGEGPSSTVPRGHRVDESADRADAGTSSGGGLAPGTRRGFRGPVARAGHQRGPAGAHRHGRRRGLEPLSRLLHQAWWTPSPPTSASGHSLEATARELFVHANTVRYRLRRVSDITGWDPCSPGTPSCCTAPCSRGGCRAPTDIGL